MRVRYVFDMRQTIASAWVMCGPVRALCGALPVIVGLQPGWTLRVVKMWTEILRRLFGQHPNFIGCCVVTDRGDVFYNAATKGPRSVLHQASTALSANNPVVDVRLGHEFMTNLLPQTEVHGAPYSLTQGRGSRFRDVSICWPWRSWRYCVTSRVKIPAFNYRERRYYLVM